MTAPSARELLDEIIYRVRNPHTMDLIFRKDGVERRFEADRLKWLAARVEKVLALHENKPGVHRFCCQACKWQSNIAPCPTVRALNGEEA